MPSRVERIEELFLTALELSEVERPRFLDAQCDGDRELRDEVDELLRLDGTKDGLSRMDEVDGPGVRVGPYELREQLGEGGMGIVFRAEQREPMRRMVAVKILKRGLDSREIIARFEAERQALVLMDHPNIAKVHDAGETDDGRPYFAMELIEGVPITEYCDVTNLPLGDRIQLFLPVCRAVQHAHQNGVIHRDLKPSNVLVMMRDGVPVPVIIDFGIAKAIAAPLTDKTLYTAHHQVLGTLEYMSPEQAEMSPLRVDTRSDVYSLGVLLYELMTGVTPLDSQTLRGMALMAAQRLICETEPSRPSTRASQLGAEADEIARHRRVDPRTLIQHMRGDLDWIALRCLEKDPQRRYQSCNELALDLERHLRHEPVVAGPPGVGYRLRKFVRRNRAASAATVVVAFSLALGVVGVLFERQKTETRNAELEASARASQFRELQASIDAGSSPEPRRRVLEDIDEEHRGFVWNWLQAHSTPPAPIEILTPGSEARSVEFHPDGDHLLVVTVVPTNHGFGAGDRNGRVQILSIQAGGSPVKWECPRRAIAAHFLAEGKRVVTGDSDSGEILVWDPGAPAAEPIHEALHGAGLFALGVARDGTIASGGSDGCVRIWEAGDLTERELPEFQPHGVRISSIAFDPAGERLLVGDAAGVARILDARTGRLLVHPMTFARVGEDDWGTPQMSAMRTSLRAAEFSPDGELVAFAGYGRVSLWSADDGALVHELDSRPQWGADKPSGVAIGPDGRFVASCGHDVGLRLHSVRSGKVIATLPTGSPAGHLPLSWAVAIGPKARRAVVSTGWANPDMTSIGGKLSIWDLAELPLPVELIGHTGSVRGVLLSDDGRHVYTHDERSVRRWDLRTGRQLYVYRDYWLMPWCFALRPGENELAVGGQSGRGVVLDPRDLTVIREFELPTDINRRDSESPSVGISCVAYARGGDVLAVGPGSDWIFSDREVECPVVLFDADHFEELGRLPGYKGVVWSMAATDDGSHLIAYGSHTPSKMEFWDLGSGDPCLLARVEGVRGLHIALDPGGKRLFAQIGPGKLAAFDPYTGRELNHWDMPRRLIRDLDFHPSRNELCLTTDVGTTIWEDPPVNLLSTPGFDRAPRGLDEGACTRFVDTKGLLATGPFGFVVYYPGAAAPALYAARRAAWRAARLVRDRLDPIDVNRFNDRARGSEADPTRDRWPLVAEAAASVQSDPGLDSEVRAAALSLLEGTTDDPFGLAVTAFFAVGAPGKDDARLSRARTYAEAAVSAVRPDSYEEALYNITLGMLCWRMGDTKAARESLRIGTRLDSLRLTSRQWQSPMYARDFGATPFAILAMIEAANGDREQAFTELESAWAAGIGGATDEGFVIAAQRMLGINIAAADTAPAHSAMKVVGPPDASRYGQSTNAWFPARTDAGEAALMLEYEQAGALAALRVFEVGMPCAITKIVAFDADDREHTFWPNEHTTKDDDIYRYGGPQIAARKIGLILDTSRTGGACGIDTVRLIGLDDKQWPIRAVLR